MSLSHFRCQSRCRPISSHDHHHGQIALRHQDDNNKLNGTTRTLQRLQNYWKLFTFLWIFLLFQDHSKEAFIWNTVVVAAAADLSTTKSSSPTTLAKSDADQRRSGFIVSENKNEDQPVQYQICNGLANQLLQHSSTIALAILWERPVDIPGAFVTNGVSPTPSSFGQPVVPTPKNSVPLEQVLDVPHLIQEIEKLYLDRTTSSSAAETAPSFVRIVDYKSTVQSKLPCVEFDHFRGHADPHLIREILHRAFRPAPGIQLIVDTILERFPVHPRLDAAGLCLHHRNGADWKQHCKTWKNNGKFHDHCQGNGKLLDSVIVRWMTEKNVSATSISSLHADQDGTPTPNRFIYYVGDVPGRMPARLQAKESPFSIHSRYTLLKEELEDVMNTPAGSPSIFPPVLQHGHARDIWALIDFDVCRRLPVFMGNSVSSWSALQLALRWNAARRTAGNGKETDTAKTFIKSTNNNDDQSRSQQTAPSAYWYNGHGIPLGDLWKIFSIPIVYTYTEESSVSGKYILQASIHSVRKHLPHSPIHILYHGTNDVEFQHWLREISSLTLHVHDPVWRDMVEQLRQQGNWKSSHLFQHAGNYLGTWQRIDIPLFVNTEYCLLLDSDTIVTSSFLLNDFGAELTSSIAMGPEVKSNDKIPLNAGVMLMHVPFLRETYQDFMDYLYDHAKTGQPFHRKAPSDQGAYLDFYDKVSTRAEQKKKKTGSTNIKFLPHRFNFKPYWLVYGDDDDDDDDDKDKNGGGRQRQQRRGGGGGTDMRRAKIVHFHGLKPHHYISAAASLGGHLEITNSIMERPDTTTNTAAATTTLSEQYKCPRGIQFLCERVQYRPSWACASMERLAYHLVAVRQVQNYCHQVYMVEGATAIEEVNDNTTNLAMSDLCRKTLLYLGHQSRQRSPNACSNLTEVMHRVVLTVSEEQLASWDLQDQDLAPPSKTAGGVCHDGGVLRKRRRLLWMLDLAISLFLFAFYLPLQKKKQKLHSSGGSTSKGNRRAPPRKPNVPGARTNNHIMPVLRDVGKAFACFLVLQLLRWVSGNWLMTSA